MRSAFAGLETFGYALDIVATDKGHELNTRSELLHGQAMVNRYETKSLLAQWESATNAAERRRIQSAIVNLWAEVVQGNKQVTNAKAARDFYAMQDVLVGLGIVDARDQFSLGNKNIAKFASKILRAK